MDIADDIRRIEAQERALRFAAFDAGTAWTIGLYLRQAGEARRAGIVIDISLWSMPLFTLTLPGAAPSNHDWVRRKRNCVQYFGRSSYLTGRLLARDGKTLKDQGDLPERDFAVHGGAFPIAVADTGIVGAISVSGLPQREDHGLVVEALAHALRLDPGEFALD